MEFFWFSLVGTVALGILFLYLALRGELYPWAIYIALGAILLFLVPILKLPGYWLIIPGAMLILSVGVPVVFSLGLSLAAGLGGGVEED